MSGRYESFVVRIWRRGRSLIRGEVTQVATGDSRYFSELGDVTTFISERVAAASPDSDEATGDDDGAEAPSIVEPISTKESGQHAADSPADESLAGRPGVSEQHEAGASFPREGPEGESQRIEQ